MKKIYLDELEELATKIVKYSDNDIANKINDLKNLTKNLDWQGNAYDTYIEEYNKKINKVVEWNNNLSKLASFLLDAKSDYQDTNNKVNKEYIDMIEELERLKKLERN